ncbi:cell wall metabolism sensor histidine kinase WalK [Bacillaceae bacterium SIJ1]|uniref:cell wall metabolism sensor histidine kinase WalK n=1 Tax=Litoribacterium kuwaitense TaxID=1398745 RepID=UPI0013EA3EF3|nr:cell wall metabolism sensor histidine kinase WalK [Litoribacterium kuwaitense]NGP45222.1 cell wall metabolism sensor histidine kinase WalK [Litoribacterium kuwaitense]
MKSRERVSFFKSIHVKIILVYVLLLLIAMQVIGVYFVQELEEQLLSSFSNSTNERAHVLAYTIEEEMLKERGPDDPSLESTIRDSLRDFISNDIREIQVIDSRNRVLMTSNPYDTSIVGKRTLNLLVKRSLVVGVTQEKWMIDPRSGDRLRVVVVPFKSGEETIGAIYVSANAEQVYDQLSIINDILIKGVVIALLLTIVLGVFLANTITRPVADMRKQALVLAKGDFSRKVKVYGDDEIGQLAYTFNGMTRKLEEAQATTDSERRKLSSVLTHMTDGVIATDRYGQVILVNQPAEQMLSASGDEMVGKPIVQVLRLEEEGVTWEGLFRDMDSMLLDYSDTLPENEQLIVKASFSVIQKESGLPNGLITVLHDVTEQEQIERERREFVANVSHELRTPLTTMKSYIEALTDGAWQDDKLAPKFLYVTQNETDRMIRLVNDLLQLSKMDSKEEQLHLVEVDVVDFFNHIIDRFEMTKGDDFHFDRSLPEEPLYVALDQDKITQVLDNVLSNALKYSPEGGTIIPSLEKQGEFVKISIKDEGVGIARDKVDKIFDRFYRADKARSRKLGGTGLGLAIAREMVLAHGGKIWATSALNNGTTIHLTLPIRPQDGQEVDNLS